MKTTILAINPGTRYTGIAVLKGEVLFDWSIKAVNGRLTLAKRCRMARLVYKLISEHEPDIVVLKKLHASRSSQYLDWLCQDIETIAKESGTKLVKYSIDEVKQFFVPEEDINKVRLAELICQKHPILWHELKKEKSSTNPYHIRTFEAVALGTMAQATASDFDRSQLV